MRTIDGCGRSLYSPAHEAAPVEGISYVLEKGLSPLTGAMNVVIVGTYTLITSHRSYIHDNLKQLYIRK